MRLKRVQIRGFRSVSRTLILHVRPTLTCLIGANEHGKSNLLDVIQKLQSPEFSEFDRYSHSDDPTEPHLQFVFELSNRERGKLVDLLRGELKTANQTLRSLQEGSPDDAEATKRTENNVRWTEKAVAHYQLPTNTEVTVDVDNGGKYRIGLTHFSYPNVQRPSWVKYFGTAIPEIRLFEASDELADRITLAALESRENLPFEGLLKLAGKWNVRDKLFGADIKAERHLIEAGKTVTRKLRGIWTQGAKHTFRFAESGGYLRVSIEDPTTIDMPSSRSLGFRSFLALALSLYAETDSLSPEGYVLLFDEPGIHLHPQGQKDLLRELRRLSEQNQIIYTTHSPFMIDRNDLDATILVRKETSGVHKGTQLTYRPYAANWASLSSALGLTPSDAFFPPERSLLVEGTSDRAYLAKYMSLCADTLKADLNYLSILDADRREEIEASASILIGAGRDIVVLTDADAGGKDWEKNLRRRLGGRANQLQFINMRSVSGVDKPVSIEDLLPFGRWIDAVETWMREVLKKNHAVDRDAVKEHARTLTLGRAMADYLALAGVIENHKKFSKTNVADFFCRGEVPMPAKTESMYLLCVEVTRRLALAHS